MAYSGVTFILLPGAKIDTKGGGTLTTTGPTTSPSTSSLPTALQPEAGLFQSMAIYDASATPVRLVEIVTSTSRKHLRPESSSDVAGRSDAQLKQRNRSCGEIVADSVAFNGNATFDDTGAQRRAA